MPKNYCSSWVILYHVLRLHIFKLKFVPFSDACLLRDKRQFVFLLHFENSYLSQKSRPEVICILTIVHRSFWPYDEVFEGQS